MNSYSFNQQFNFSGSTIYDIKESDDHIMWFATGDGLVSFDGVNFKTYLNPDYGIAYYKIKFDSQGRVWCANFGGQLFYLENDSMHLALNWSKKGDFINDYFLHQLPFVYVMSVQRAELVRFELGNPGAQSQVYKGEGGGLYATHNKFEIKFASIKKAFYSPQKPSVKIYDSSLFSGKEKLSDAIILPEIKGKTGVLLNAGNTYVYEADKNFTLIKLADNSADTVFRMEKTTNYDLNGVVACDNQIWVLTRQGAIVLDTLSHQPVKKALTGVSVSSAHLDFEGNIWLGTLNRGIYIVPNTDFVHTDFSNGYISQSQMDENRGLYIQDDQGDIWYTRRPYNTAHKILKEPIPPAPMHYDALIKRLYLGQHQFYYDLNSKMLKQNSERGITSTLFKETASLGKGNFVSTSYAYSFFHSDNRDVFWKNFNLEIVDKFGGISIIRPYRSHHLGITLDEKSIYIDYVDGLIVYSEDEPPQWVYFKGKEVQAAQILPDLNETNAVWVTTKTRFLLKIIEGKVVFSHPLPEVMYRLAIDGVRVFLAGKEGVYRLNVENEKLDYIGEALGFNPVQIRGLFIENDTLLIVGGHGVQKIPADVDTEFIDSTPVYITGYASNGENLNGLDDIVLAAHQNNISFNFRALSPRSRKTMFYEYRLASLGDEWTQLSGKLPEARFPNLGPGNYVFQVRACMSLGKCSEVEEVSFMIMPPFYQRWWFYVLVFALASSTVGFFVWWRFRMEARENQRKSEQAAFQKEMYKSKIAALRSQMNPHFMFNALNTIQEFIITNQEDIASEYLADFADLMRMYLNQSNQDEVRLRDEETLLQLYLRLENMRFNDTLDYAIEIDSEINKDSVKIPMMLLQPHVENSIKHGLLHLDGVKVLRVRIFKFNDESLHCIIEDNGIGREASEKINSAKTFKHKSFSTGANQNRIQLINQIRNKKIEVTITDLHQNGLACGTRVAIILPIN
ncbi:MAG: histidine kinase [Cryomorphaceae bacterium]|nr:histidine kinase [Cryomorphaceae bacterium]